MENSKKTVKVLSYIFYVFAVLDLILIALSVMILCGANVNASLLGTDADAVKGTFIAVAIGYAIDFILTVYLAAKGIRVSNGTIKGKSFLTVALVLFALEVVAIIANVYFLATGKGNTTQLISDAISAACIYLYYANCKKAIAD